MPRPSSAFLGLLPVANPSSRLPSTSLERGVHVRVSKRQVTLIVLPVTTPCRSQNEMKSMTNAPDDPVQVPVSVRLEPSYSSNIVNTPIIPKHVSSRLKPPRTGPDVCTTVTPCHDPTGKAVDVGEVGPSSPHPIIPTLRAVSKSRPVAPPRVRPQPRHCYRRQVKPSPIPAIEATPEPDSAPTGKPAPMDNSAVKPPRAMN